MLQAKPPYLQNVMTNRSGPKCKNATLKNPLQIARIIENSIINPSHGRASNRRIKNACARTRRPINNYGFGGNRIPRAVRAEHFKMPFIQAGHYNYILSSFFDRHPNGGTWLSACRGQRLNLKLFRKRASDYFTEYQIQRLRHASHYRRLLSERFRQELDFLNALLQFAEHVKNCFKMDVSDITGLGQERFITSVNICLELLKDWRDPCEGRPLTSSLRQRDESPGRSLESAIIIQ